MPENRRYYDLTKSKIGGQNTGIRVEAIREVNDSGEQGYRVTKIEALTAKNLPEIYQKGERPVAILGTGWTDPENRLFLYDWKKVTYIANWSYVWSRFYTAEDMKKINSHIKAAGQHLADVNAHLAKEREAWHGKVTFVDGVATKDEAVFHKQPSDEPIKLAEKIAELWGEGRLLYRNSLGHIKPLKPLK